MEKQTFKTKNFLASLEQVLEIYLVKKAPLSIPENIKEILVKIYPYLVILSLVLSGFSILSIFGLGAFLAPSLRNLPEFRYFFSVSYLLSVAFFSFLISLVLTIISMIFQVLAIPGLFRREEKAWRYIFYSSLIGLVSGLVLGGVIGVLVSGFISLYLLFQVKSYYKN
ncbi:MAG: hypothetical protein NZL96_03960 [Patescibacteria group bacterium]|nr:hypothetical protein [Patescibacteria group bacterium]